MQRPPPHESHRKNRESLHSHRGIVHKAKDSGVLFLRATAISQFRWLQLPILSKFGAEAEYHSHARVLEDIED